MEVIFDDSGPSPTWIGGNCLYSSECFVLYKCSGLQRCPAGDSDHFEAETKISFTIMRFVIPEHRNKMDHAASEGGSSIVVVSKGQ